MVAIYKLRMCYQRENKIVNIVYTPTGKGYCRLL